MADGETIIDDYRLIDRIATSKTSQIWEVVDKRSSQHLAMKLLLPSTFSQPGFIQAVKHEAKVLKSLNHPNIIKYHGVGVTKRHAYLVTELFRSTNLKSRLTNDPLGVQSQMGTLVSLVCLSVAHVHERGWIHKDIKPDNILFNHAQELRLIDFSVSSRAVAGVARLLARKSKTIQGTRTYIAPELIRREPPTPSTDIYSLGVMLFELVTGSLPFTGSSPKDLLARHLTSEPPKPSDLNPNVTPDMDRFVLRMLKKKPEQRYPDMNAVLSEFRGLNIFRKDVWEANAKRGQQPASVDSAEPAPANHRDAAQAKRVATGPKAAKGGASSRDDTKNRSRPNDEDLPFMEELPPVV